MSKRQDKIQMRKRIYGGRPPVTTFMRDFYPVFHVPEHALTIYQVFTPKGCSMTGSRYWCTTANLDQAESYLKNGNLYVVHAGRRVSQVSTSKRATIPSSWRDHDNKALDINDLVNAYPSLMMFFDVCYYGRFYDHRLWSRMKVIEEIRRQVNPQERLRYLKGIIEDQKWELEGSPINDSGIRRGTSGVWSYRAQDYRSVGAWLKPHDLVHFADDPADIIQEHIRTFCPVEVKKPERTWNVPEQLSLFRELPRKTFG